MTARSATSQSGWTLPPGTTYLTLLYQFVVVLPLMICIVDLILYRKQNSKAFTCRSSTRLCPVRSHQQRGSSPPLHRVSSGTYCPVKSSSRPCLRPPVQAWVPRLLHDGYLTSRQPRPLAAMAHRRRLKLPHAAEASESTKDPVTGWVAVQAGTCNYQRCGRRKILARVTYHHHCRWDSGFQQRVPSPSFAAGP